MSETDVVNRAVQNLKHFKYVDKDKLVDDVKMLYPSTSVIVIVDNDKRDGAGIPTVTFKTLGKMTLTVLKTQSYSGGRMYKDVVNCVTGKFDHVLCVIQDGYVTVKKNRLTFKGS
jgi:hypothetical protein